MCHARNLELQWNIATTLQQGFHPVLCDSRRVQSLFSSLSEEIPGKTIGLGGDGRYFNKEAAQIIIKLAAGNGLKKVVVGQNAIMSTPAMSAVIREQKLYGEPGTLQQ